MSQKLTTEEFIERAKKVHGDKYDYSKAKYINRCMPVTIVCPIHGPFEQRASSHVDGSGCPCCGNESRRTTAIANMRAAGANIKSDDSESKLSMFPQCDPKTYARKGYGPGLLGVTMLSAAPYVKQVCTHKFPVTFAEVCVRKEGSYESKA